MNENFDESIATHQLILSTNTTFQQLKVYVSEGACGLLALYLPSYRTTRFTMPLTASGWLLTTSITVPWQALQAWDGFWMMTFYSLIGI